MQDLYYDFGFGPVPAHTHPKGGGWVADTASVTDTCYVGPYARVYGKATVSGNAKIDGYAEIFGEAIVMDEAKVYGAAKVYQKARVSGRARVSGEALVHGASIVTDDALVYENAEIYENAKIRNYSEIHGHAKVRSNANVIENAKVYDNCIVTRQPLIITGVAAGIVVTDHHATVGCVTLPPSIWKEHGKTMVRFFTKLPGIDSPRIISEKWIDGLTFAVDIHGCTDLPEEVKNFNVKEKLSEILSNDRFWTQNA